MKYKVYSWDFVKKTGNLIFQTNNLDEAKNEANKVAKGFCEDEKLTVISYDDIKTIAYFTGCDFGVIIREL